MFYRNICMIKSLECLRPCADLARDAMPVLGRIRYFGAPRLRAPRSRARHAFPPHLPRAELTHLHSAINPHSICPTKFIEPRRPLHIMLIRQQSVLGVFAAVWKVMVSSPHERLDPGSASVKTLLRLQATGRFIRAISRRSVLQYRPPLKNRGQCLRFGVGERLGGAGAEGV